MSERPLVTDEDVELVRSIYERWNAGDLALDAFAEDVDFRQSDHIIGTTGQFRGHEGIDAAAREIFRAWDRVEWRPQAFHRFGSTIAVPVVCEARGRSSGAMTTIRVWHLAQLRNGKVARWDTLVVEA